MSPRHVNAERSDDSGLGEEASRWVVRLLDARADTPMSPTDRARLNEEFFVWLKSPQHVRAIFEAFEAYKLVAKLDPDRLRHAEQLLAPGLAEVIPLHGRLQRTYARSARRRHRWTPLFRDRRSVAVAAIMLLGVAVVSGTLWVRSLSSYTYTTAVGEQHTCKLDDGSFVYLNTDSKIRVRYTASERQIDLVRGEALFTAQHDSRRPFIVSTGSANIRAVGTQFNVRRRASETDVSVVEGVVQIAATAPAHYPEVDMQGANRHFAWPSNPATRLAAGEEAQVKSDEVEKRDKPNVEKTLLWRSRRLDFADSSFAEVAGEFNRYNKTQIRVEGTATEKRLTGIFYADRPQDFLKYVMRDESLSVAPRGDNWVIKSQ